MTNAVAVPEMTPALTGGCLCGGVRYRIDTQPAAIQLCHCRQCRKAQGSAFAANLPVPAADFHLEAGSEWLRAWSASPGKQRVFCGRCGSPLYSVNERVPGVVRVRAGTVDDGLAARPALHFHVASKAAWWTIDDDLPQHPGAIPPAR